MTEEKIRPLAIGVFSHADKIFWVFRFQRDETRVW